METIVKPLVTISLNDASRYNLGFPVMLAAS